MEDYNIKEFEQAGGSQEEETFFSLNDEIFRVRLPTTSSAPYITWRKKSGMKIWFKV